MPAKCWVNVRLTSVTDTVSITSRIGAGQDAKGPKHVFYSRWAKQPFTGGATTSPVSTASGTSPLDFEALSRPLWNGRLGFAGEHTEINRMYQIKSSRTAQLM